MAENSTTLHPQSGSTSPKLGLALSGGGFRASLFHIGVLARMADLGLLRQVEVISTVSGGSSAAFGVPEPAQSLISAIRTDLDSFCDIEAYALMVSGYRMSNRELSKLGPLVPASAATVPDGNWPFLQLESKAMWKNASDDLQKYLRVAGKSALKPLHWPSGKILAVAYLVIIALLAAYVGCPLAQWAYDVGGVMQYVIYVGLVAVLGAAAVSLYLATFNVLYLHIGRLPDK